MCYDRILKRTSVRMCYQDGGERNGVIIEVGWDDAKIDGVV